MIKKKYARFLSKRVYWQCYYPTFYFQIYYDFLYRMLNTRKLVSGLFCFEIPKAGNGL